MSARSRLKPWFSKAPTMRDLERSAQIHYGWDDWRDPLTSLLKEAEYRFFSEQLQRFFWCLEDAAVFLREFNRTGRIPMDGSGGSFNPNWPGVQWFCKECGRTFSSEEDFKVHNAMRPR